MSQSICKFRYSVCCISFSISLHVSSYIVFISFLSLFSNTIFVSSYLCHIKQVKFCQKKVLLLIVSHNHYVDYMWVLLAQAPSLRHADR